ncbi:Hypothetical Protein FCC1311_117462, partial [Hondaea fermentalgiana]
MAPLLTAFAAVSAAREAGSAQAREAELAAAGSAAGADAYAGFHAEQLRELKLSEHINSLCLPVYAVPLAQAKPKGVPAGEKKAAAATAQA